MSLLYALFRIGYDKDGYDKHGFNRSGFDRNGYDKDGFNLNGYDKDGYSKIGFNKSGFDRNGYDKDGFNLNGYDKDGYDKSGFTRSGFDGNGYDKNGYDKDGYGKHGFNKSGFDRNGYDKDGFDLDGYDKNGYNKIGFNKSCFDRNSYDKDSFDSDEYNCGNSLTKRDRDQDKKIKEIIKRRRIKYLVHFTRIENLCSILKNGLIPVSLQQTMQISSVHNDEQRIDSKLDCTSCSISFPNYKVFYTFRELKFSGMNWVVIVLDKDVLFSPCNIAYYCHTNAAGVFPRISSAKALCTASAFENMFCDSLTTKENKLIQRDSLKISDYLTTDPQAEILIGGVIDKKYIRCVCFQNELDIDEYISKNGKESLGKFDYQIVPGFFDARKDYMFWKKESFIYGEKDLLYF